MDADFVTDRIMVGSRSAAVDPDLPATGVTAILNVAREVCYDSPLPFAKVGLTDGPDNPPFALHVAVATLTSLLAVHKKVLVHCAAGASRSVIVVCCYLVSCGGRDNFADALALVRRGRKNASPNAGLQALAEMMLDERVPSVDALARTSFGRAVASFNEQAYLRKYADVAAAVAKGAWRNGLEHFSVCGFKEGRTC
jgi:hypothetical protein